MDCMLEQHDSFLIGSAEGYTSLPLSEHLFTLARFNKINCIAIETVISDILIYITRSPDNHLFAPEEAKIQRKRVACLADIWQTSHLDARCLYPSSIIPDIDVRHMSAK